MMKTIAIANLKGGVGKTTTAVNLAYTLSQNYHVLVVDMDPQCNCTKFFAKVNSKGHTVQDVLCFPEKVKKAVRRTKYQNLDIVRGKTDLSAGDPFAMMWALAAPDIRDVYDFCIIDTRPVFDDLTETALYASDVMLTPIKFDNYCRDNLALLEHAYQDILEINTGLRWMIFANMVSNAKAQRKAMQDLLERHDYPIMDNCISRSVVVDNALDLYKPVVKHRKNSVVATDYTELAKELVDSWEV